jgi:hypothetical protein
MTQSCQIKQRYTFHLHPAFIDRNLSIESSVALLRLVAGLFVFLLIFNEQCVPKITFVLALTYYVKPHLFVTERAYTSEGYRKLAFLSIDVKRDLIGCL